MADDHRLDKLRADMAAHGRANTATGDVRRARRLVADILLRHKPDDPLGRKLAACGSRDAKNNPYRCNSPACPRCMWKKGDDLFVDHLWLALGTVPSEHLRWATVIMFATSDLDAGAIEMKRQHRRLSHIFKKFSSETGKTVRVFGAREVERRGNEWTFHVHMLLDMAGADPDILADKLRSAWSGHRAVQVKPMDRRKPHNSNLKRIGEYMTKARYSNSVGRRNIWLPDRDIVDLAMWRAYRVPLQWHRFTLAVRNFEIENEPKT